MHLRSIFEKLIPEMTPSSEQNPYTTLTAARPNRLKRLVGGGEIAVGTLMSFDAPWLVEMFGMTGYDFVTIDLEHEPIDPAAVFHLVRAAENVGMTAIVRMPASDAIYPMLTTGAQGIWIPDLRSREHAEEIVQYTRHAPVGRRTYYTQTRAAQYGVGIDESNWTSEADAELLVVAMIEDIALVDELDEILAVDGIDGYHVGTLDLAQSMGSPPPEKLDEAVTEIVARCRTAGKLTSVGVVTPWAIDGVQKRVDQGVDILTVASAWMLTNAVGTFLEDIEKRIPDDRRTRTGRTPTPNQYVNPQK
jgi:2-keto-3-deoxy-L-rhamnonate aldolase RhmA